MKNLNYKKQRKIVKKKKEKSRTLTLKKRYFIFSNRKQLIYIVL